MLTTLRMRYHKKGMYDGHVFIANQKLEPEAYATLAAFSKRLAQINPGQYRNPYHDPSKGYVTITFKPYPHGEILAKCGRGDEVEINFGIAKVVRDDRTFYNPVLQSLKHIKSYEPPEQNLLDVSGWLPSSSDADEELTV